VFEFKATPVPY